MSDEDNRSDEQDRAEALDPDMIDPELHDIPPDQPLGVDDPTVDDRVTDDIEARRRREMPDHIRPPRPLVQPWEEEDEALLDDEADLVAEALVDARDPESDPAPPPAEEAALHLEDEEE